MSSRPQHFPYAFASLVQAPRRIIKPPSPLSRDSLWALGSPEAAYARVRSFSLTPSFKVSLSDVLEKKLLPPLTPSEFQSYLIHVERSCENLYFYCWLKDYEKAYRAIPTGTEEHGKALQSLNYFFLRARETFLIPNSPSELNLEQHQWDDLNQKLRDRNKALQNEKMSIQPPDPSLFASINTSVEKMLTDSLTHYLSHNSGNAGRNRGLFAVFLGVLIMAIGILPILFSYTFDHPRRWMRLAAFAPFWLGSATLIMGLHGICILIFLFGDARQLYPYELAKPPITRVANDQEGQLQPSFSAEASRPTGSSDIMPSAPLNSSNTSSYRIDWDAFLTHEPPAPKLPSFSLTYPDKVYGGELPLATTESSDKIYTSDREGLPKSQGLVDIPTLPSNHPNPCDNQSRAIFAPLTDAPEPLIRRIQWEVVMRSCGMAVLVAGIICGIVVAA